jgi:small subunit ribosomal protein S9
MKTVNTSGKRKRAIARVSITKGNGRVYINKKPLEIHSPEMARNKIMEPLLLIDSKASKIDVKINVEGGGVMGQADASRTALARGIVEFFGDDNIYKMYKEYDRTLLVNDVRRKLPKLPLGRGARKKRQKSYR